MFKLTGFLQLMVFGMVIILAACGGGKSGESNLSSKQSSLGSSNLSNAAVSSSSSVTSSGLSEASSSVSNVWELTLVGKVVATGAGGASVVISAGDQIFNGMSDNFGNFSVPIAVNESNCDIPIKIIVTGSGNNNWVELASLLASTCQLVARAGNNSILDSGEYPNLLVSSLTTAEFALVMETEGIVKTDEQRKHSLLNLSIQEQSELAVLNHLLLNDVDFSLPQGIKNTLELLSDRAEREVYIEYLRRINPSIFSDVLETFESNSSDSQIKFENGQYLIVSDEGVYRLALVDNGVGSLSLPVGGLPNKIWVNNYLSEDAFFDKPITWVQKGNQIKIALNDPLISSDVSFISEYQNEIGSNNVIACPEIPCRAEVDTMILTLLSNNDTTIHVSSDFSINVYYNEDVFFSKVNSFYSASMIPESALIAPSEENLVGVDWYTNSNRYTFNSGGVGSKLNLNTRQEKQITWSVKDNHIDIDGGKGALWLFGTDKTVNNVVELDASAPADLARMWMVKRSELDISASDLTGRWTSYPATKRSDTFDLLDGEWYRYDYGVTEPVEFVDQRSYKAVFSDSSYSSYDLLSIVDNKYYFSVCSVFGEEIEYVWCGVQVRERDVDFARGSFSLLRTVFHDPALGNAWHFSYFGISVVKPDNSIDFKSEGYYTKASAGKLLFESAASSMYEVMDVTGVSDSTIKVCRYPIFQTCNPDNAIFLQRGVEVKLSSNLGSGVSLSYQVGVDINGFASEYQYLNFGEISNMIPRQFPVSLSVNVWQGFLLNKIEGCEGEYNVDAKEYNLPALDQDCTITVDVTAE